MSGSSSISGAAKIAASPSAETAPSMGWNSWLAKAEAYYPNGPWQATETYIKQQSDAMKALQPYGYNLMSVDGGWANRDSSGNIQGIPSQFPSGMSSLGSYVHANGQRFGLYITPRPDASEATPSRTAMNSLMQRPSRVGASIT
ncbi:alpha-amylase family protein [Terriglobus aquaticus]|uniref:Alpha-galactosidase n=2 Tax=Terriglobus aquaticus TaxID=940139 RepID=A0ABW9KKY7_9BACT